MSLVKITVPLGVTVEVRQLLGDSKKIQAIKLIRSKGKVIAREDPRVSLREAKYAVDHLSGYGSTTSPVAILVPEWSVNSLIVSGPAGEKIELNIDELQMHFLTSLHSVGLDEVSRLMELVDFVRRWQGLEAATTTVDATSATD